jgi:nitroreductase
MNGEALLKLFNDRQSVRTYSARLVEKDKLMRCVEAARLAPSACNAQPWKYIIIDNPDLKNAVAELTTDALVTFNRFAAQAPLIVAVVREQANFLSGVGQILKNKEYPLIDIGISTVQFCLQATAEGLGTCMLGWFKEKKIKELLHIPADKRLELLITVGYPATNDIRRKARKETSEILSFNRYK